MKTVAVANQKGGVGKTTTAVNLAYELTRRNKKVLLVDFDPQGNATSGFGVSKHRPLSVYDLLLDPDKAEGAVAPTEYGDILPANINLAGAEIELVEMEGRHSRLRDGLARLGGRYEYTVIDCPPSLGLLTVNAFSAADSVLVPMQAEYFALEGLSELINLIKMVRRGMNPRLEVEGVLLTMYDGRTNLSLQVVEELKRYFPNKLYGVSIPRNIRLAEAPSHGQPIFRYDRLCRGAEAYSAVAEEFLKRQK